MFLLSAPRRLCAPSSVLLMASLIFSLLACPEAHAGTYTWTVTNPDNSVTQSPSFTGGTVSVVTSGPKPITKSPPPPPGFTTSNGTYTGGGGCMTTSVPPSAGPGSVTIPANPIVATFTWQPAAGQTSTTDPPPPAVIMQQNCTAQWQAQTITGTATVGGTASCGLPNPTATQTKDSNGNIIGVTSSGVAYSAVSSPGVSFSVPAQGSQFTPTASFTPTAGTGAADGSASVTYQVQAYPVTVTPGGTTLVSGMPEALTGQQIVASVNAPFPIDPTSYHWDVSGGMFKNYDWTLASNQETELSDTDYFQSTFTFYDATAETLTLKSNVTVVCPDGTRLMVNPQASINILKPAETAWAISSTSSPDGGFYYDYSNGPNGPVFNPQYGVQVTWNPITMTVPSPFLGGQVCLVQNANLSRVDTRAPLNGASSTYVLTPTGQGLDTGFPYLIAYQLDNNGNIVSDSNGTYATLSPPQWSISGSGPTPGAGGDHPFQNCEPTLVSGDNGGIDWRSSTSTDQFNTWTMYRPPAVGNYSTVWVPVQMIQWGWTGSAKDTDANGNVVYDSSNNPQWFFTTPQVDPAGNPANTTMFPTWSTIIPYGLTMGPSAQ